MAGAFVAVVGLGVFGGVGSWCSEASGKVSSGDDKRSTAGQSEGDLNQLNNAVPGSPGDFVAGSAPEVASESAADSPEPSDSAVSPDADQSVKTIGDAGHGDVRDGASSSGASDGLREVGGRRTGRAFRVADGNGAQQSGQTTESGDVIGDQGRGGAQLVPASRMYVHGFFTASVGDSLRFNNPFRLSYQLGKTGESVSATPLYLNLGAAGAFGNPDGFQHGASLQWSRQLWGLPQNVVTPSYLLLYGGWRPWLAFARAGIAVILNPDSGAGAEVSLGGAYMLTGGIGLQAELVGNLFYGAATWDKTITTIPMLSMQVGVIVDLERLP